MARCLKIVVVISLSLAPASGQDSAPAEVAKRAQQILTQRCFHCHGLNGQAEANIFVLDRDRLVSEKVVTPGNPTSKLLRVIEAGLMPADLAEKNEKLPDAELAVLRSWVGAGAPPFDDKKAPPRKFLSDQVLLGEIEADLRAADSRSRQFLRYFSIAHLYNGDVADDELEGYRIGLAKLLNSLSWQQEIAVPRPINASKTLLRIDLRDYKWEAATWKRILADYPYGHRPPGAQAIQDQSGAELPYVRADWMVATASVPPLYHDLLELPTTLQPLEARLQVDVKRNIQDEHGVARGGIRNSGVSRNNRVVERHNSAFGAYWKSYDFSSSQGEQDMFRNPLDLHPAGGEMVFHLPNGMQGYMIVNADEKRIDEAPVAIVSDRTQPEDPVVRNGISCMGCHYAGMKTFKDDVRATVKQSPGRFDHEKVLALYPEQQRLDELLEKDSRRFARAVEETGGKVSVDHRVEPINRLSRKYKASLTVELAAAEAGHEIARFKEKLEASRILKALGITGQLTGPNPGIKRDTWEENFGLVVKELGLGDYRTPAGRYPGGPSAAGSLDGYEVSLSQLTDFTNAARDVVRFGAAAKSFLDSQAKTEDESTASLLQAIGAALENKPAAEGVNVDPAAVEPAAKTLALAAHELLALKDKALSAITASIGDRSHSDVSAFLANAESRIYEALCIAAIGIYLNPDGSFSGTFDGMFAGLDKYDRQKIGDAFLETLRDTDQTSSIRQLAAEGLAQRGTSRHQAALREIIADAGIDEPIRRRALYALARLGDRGPVERMLAEIAARMDRLKKTDMTPQEIRAWAEGYDESAVLAQNIHDNDAAIRSYESFLRAVEPIQDKLGTRDNLSIVHYNLACLHSLVGDIEAGLKALDRAFEAGYAEFQWANTDGDLTNIRKDARFKAMIARRQGSHSPPSLLQPEHEVLKLFVGSWEGSPTRHYADGSQETSHYNELDLVFFDGLFLYRINESSGGAGTEYRSITGYDRHRRKFVSVEVGAHVTRPTLTEAVWDERTRTFTSAVPNYAFADGTFASLTSAMTVKDSSTFSEKGSVTTLDGKLLNRYEGEFRRTASPLQLPSGTIKESVTLAKEHQLLQEYAGNWEGTATVHSGGATQTGKATEANGLFSGGTWLQIQLAVEVNGGQFHVLQFVGFDPAANKFWVLWVDTKGRFELGESTAFDDESGTIAGEAYDGNGRRVRWTEAISWVGGRRLVTWTLLDVAGNVDQKIELNLLKR